MKHDIDYISRELEKHPEYKSAVFDCGYIISNKELVFGDSFPYYGNWKKVSVTDGIYIYYHSRQHVFVYNGKNASYFSIGHAYDPFGYEWDENKLLYKFDQISDGVFEKGIEYLNDWTGLFAFGVISSGSISFCGDFESMRATYYCKSDSKWIIGSHENLIALNTPLTYDPYVDKLENYKWYYLYGEGLPGDITHYKELKKLIGNTYIIYKDDAFHLIRMYPQKDLKMVSNEQDYEKTVEDIASIMSRSLELIAKKWEKPAVSTTGGKDSQGSLAAAVHIKDRYQFFSYNSQHAEKVDCDAAEVLCNAAGVKHSTYDIPLNKDKYPEYDLVKAIISYNGNRRKLNHNDIMKRIFFRKNNDFDVEVKSWTSEIGRGFYYKRYGVKHLQKKCTPRLVNIMNNIYLFNPVLMYKTDNIYRDFLERSLYNEHMFNYDWTDIIDLEMRDGQWGTSIISVEHLFAYDVTIPYNNRHLGDMFLSVPLNDRIADRTHIDFIKKLCPEIWKANISVRDYSHDKKRMLMDRIYYFVSSIRPL